VAVERLDPRSEEGHTTLTVSTRRTERLGRHVTSRRQPFSGLSRIPYAVILR
jgi:hypothetical protein